MKTILQISVFMTLVGLFVSCTTPEDRALEATLTFAGSNRVELEKVLHHYKDEPLKQKAARFLIAHMKDSHFYRYIDGKQVFCYKI